MSDETRETVAVRVIERGGREGLGTVYRGRNVSPGEVIDVAVADLGAFLAGGFGELVDPPAPEPGQVSGVARRMAEGRSRWG